MTFVLEEAPMSKTAGLSRRNEFRRYILETKIPGVHYNHVDGDVGPSKATMTHLPQILNFGRPCLVDGAHEDHLVPGYQLSSDGWGSRNCVMKILQDHEGDPSIGGEEYVGEPTVIIGDIFHSRSLEYLEKTGPFLMKNLDETERNCSMLLAIADKLTVLTPANDPLPWDIMNMSQWKASLCELIKEMKTIEEKCPSLTCNPSVYVLTASPYDAFLRALAAEIADATGY